VASALLLVQSVSMPITAKATSVAKAMPYVANEKRSNMMTTMDGKNYYLLRLLYIKSTYNLHVTHVPHLRGL
jgi:hypothetical protein